MRLPDPNSADENDVPFVRHEGQAEEVLHLGAINLLGPAPLEVFQQFDSGEASGGDASLHAPLLANLSLSVDESSQIVDVGPVLRGADCHRYSRFWTGRHPLRSLVFTFLKDLAAGVRVKE